MHNEYKPNSMWHFGLNLPLLLHHKNQQLFLKILWYLYTYLLRYNHYNIFFLNLHLRPMLDIHKAIL